MTRLILASASPRRRELIRLFGQPVEVWTAEVDEDSVTHPDPAVNVVETAALKAEDVARRAPADAVIIAADTTVALGERMLNKPADAAEAAAMLRLLRGQTHQVHTGIVVINVATGQEVRDVATVDVPMRPYSDDEINAYIATGDPLDKAGAYAIQHPGFRPVESLSGCYAAVVGLPLCHLARALRRVGAALPGDIATACQANHAYNCPIYPTILSAET
jgi:MAF protein